MKKILTLSFCLPFFLGGQITINDNFTDGNLSQNPQWLGQDSLFTVNQNLQLQLNDSLAGESFLALPSQISLNASWEFYLKLDFNPSSSNYAKIYLISDKADINQNSRGYFLKVGGTTDDKLSLFRTDEKGDVLLLESAASYLDLSNVELRIKVSRDSNMIWELQSDTGTFVNPLISHGTFMDSTFKKCSYFGISAKYTITRSDRFYFDDFVLHGDTFTDLKAPVLDSVYAATNRELWLFFDEELNTSTAGNPLNYTISPEIGIPITALYNPLKPGEVKLSLNKDLLHAGNYQIQLQNISDRAGNISNQSFSFNINNPPPELLAFNLKDSTSLQLEFSKKMDTLSALDITNYGLSSNSVFPVKATFYNGDSSIVLLTFDNAFELRDPQNLSYENLKDRFGNKISGSISFTRFNPVYGDILINEIMVDPSPVVGVPPDNLPEAEYLELYNPNPFAINLKGWNFKTENKDHFLSAGLILADSFLVICKDEVMEDFPSSVPLLGIDMSSSAFTNSGTEISLISPEGVLISNINYTIDWYKDANKKNGGWSLERIDPLSSCEGEENWMASKNPQGGTPGSKNSVLDTYSDTIPPQFKNIQIKSSKSIILQFSENLNAQFLNDSNNFIVKDHLQNIFPIQKAEALYPPFNEVILNFKNELDPLVTYTLSLKNFPQDCNGNSMEPDSLLFTLPSQPQMGDILINEILFNPYPEGVDFVELYNSSGRFFDLSKLRLANLYSDSVIENIHEISEDPVLFAPGEYLAFTTDPFILKEHYVVATKGNLFKVAKIPSMSDDKGSMAVATSSLKFIDGFNYDENMHLKFISDAEGISLERISFHRETDDANNWTSASAFAGYATPGYENSQMKIPVIKDVVDVVPQLFHPDRESISLTYNFEKTDNVLSISIWSSSGHKLRDVIRNKNVGQQGFYSWDGTDERGLLQPSGIYIVVFDFYNESGQREVIKKTCVVSL